MSIFEFSPVLAEVQYAIHLLSLLKSVLRVGTCKYPLNNINFEVRSVLAAMQKNWS